KKGDAKIGLKGAMENHSGNTALVDLKYVILYDGKVIAEKWTKSISLSKRNKEEQVNFNIEYKDVHLWDFDHPNLYHSNISLYRDGKLIHSLSDQYGIRKIEIDGYSLKLNGQS